MNNQSKTPLYDALVNHLNKCPVSYHVPGHKYGEVFPNIGNQEFQAFLKYDVTELSGLDDLHSPEDVILEAEKLLAELYQVQKSFFLVNGSTVGNLAMVMAVCSEGGTVLVQRNCHKSVLNAVRLAKAKPIFLEPEYDEDWKVPSGVNLETVQRAIAEFPDAKAVILTYPNYYGMVFDLKSVIKEAHSHNIPVLVDEAHGPHFILGNPFPETSIEMGADVIVQSAHKTLPAMTMGSYLHINSRLINQNKIMDYLHMLQSSSPSYPIMASLDLARYYLASYTQEDTQYVIACINEFKNELSKIPGIKVLEQPNGDPLKILIQSVCELSGFELQRRLEREGIYTELADSYNVLLIIPLLKEKQYYPFQETVLKMKRTLTGLTFKMEKDELYFKNEKITGLVIPYQEMSNYKIKEIAITEAIDHVCAEVIIPYPPGIPLLLSGEKITKQKINNLERLIRHGARFQGGSLLEAGLIKVFWRSN